MKIDKFPPFRNIHIESFSMTYELWRQSNEQVKIENREIRCTTNEKSDAKMIEYDYEPWVVKTVINVHFAHTHTHPHPHEHYRRHLPMGLKRFRLHEQVGTLYISIAHMHIMNTTVHTTSCVYAKREKNRKPLETRQYYLRRMWWILLRTKLMVEATTQFKHGKKKKTKKKKRSSTHMCRCDIEVIDDERNAKIIIAHGKFYLKICRCTNYSVYLIIMITNCYIEKHRKYLVIG